MRVCAGCKGARVQAYYYYTSASVLLLLLLLHECKRTCQSDFAAEFDLPHPHPASSSWAFTPTEHATAAAVDIASEMAQPPSSLTLPHSPRVSFDPVPQFSNDEDELADGHAWLLGKERSTAGGHGLLQ